LRQILRCQRCRNSFGRGTIHDAAAVAFAMTALTLFLLANLYPFLAIELGGRRQSIFLLSGVGGFASHGLLPLALFVLCISAIAPLTRVLALAVVLVGLRRAGRRAALATLLRLAERVHPWAMLDVFLIGTLVALTKLQDLANVEVGIGLWSLGLLVIATAVMETSIDRRALWERVGPSEASEPSTDPVRILSCTSCGMVETEAAWCRRCAQRLTRRKPASQTRAEAFVATGLVLYFPANIYPVITVVSFGRRTSATILGGVVELLNGSDWPLAIIVFTASVAVPLLKLVGLGWLLLSTRLRLRRRLADRTRLYRLIELVSRWSAVDIFVSALLTALVTLGNLATIEPGLGVLAFGGVVFVTMLAADSFDTRLMWDAAGANDV
jgi:paraquat-inducible protein A